MILECTLALFREKKKKMWNWSIQPKVETGPTDFLLEWAYYKPVLVSSLFYPLHFVCACVCSCMCLCSPGGAYLCHCQYVQAGSGGSVVCLCVEGPGCSPDFSWELQWSMSSAEKQQEQATYKLNGHTLKTLASSSMSSRVMKQAIDTSIMLGCQSEQKVQGIFRLILNTDLFIFSPDEYLHI